MRLVRYALLLVACTSTMTAQAQTRFTSDANLVASVMPSFVDISIRAVQVGAAPKTGGILVRDEVGSGVIVDPSGIIITNRHVIEGAFAIDVTLSDGNRVPAHLIGKGLNFDIAVLKIDVPRALLAAKLGDSRELRIGDHVVAIGNPQGFQGSASAGIVSAFHRNLGLSPYDDLIQTDAAINRGNSGGPLFNLAGEVVGINQAIFTFDNGSMGLGFAIPTFQVSFLLDSLKRYGEPRVGWLGVTAQTFTAGMAAALGADQGGVIIAEVAPNGPAATSGLAVGDVIRSVNGESVSDTSSMNDQIARALGKTIPINLLRDGKQMSFNVVVKQWPQALWSTEMPKPPVFRTLADFGLTLKNDHRGGSPVVATVTDKSIAARAGLRPGDIIRKVQNRSMAVAENVMAAFKDVRTLGRAEALLLLGGPNGERWISFSISD